MSQMMDSLLLSDPTPMIKGTLPTTGSWPALNFEAASKIGVGSAQRTRIFMAPRKQCTILVEVWPVLRIAESWSSGLANLLFVSSTNIP